MKGDMIICTNCGSSIQEEIKYCNICGAENNGAGSAVNPESAGVAYGRNVDMSVTDSDYKTYNYMVLVLSVLGVISVFLPWFFFSSTLPANGSTGGTGSTLSTLSVAGYITWAALPVIALFILEIVNVYIGPKNKYYIAIIPPVMILGILAVIFKYNIDHQGNVYGYVCGNDASMSSQYGYYIIIILSIGILITLLVKIMMERKTLQETTMLYDDNTFNVKPGNNTSAPINYGNESQTPLNTIPGYIAPNQSNYPIPAQKSGNTVAIIIASAVLTALIILGGVWYFYAQAQDQQQKHNEEVAKEQKMKEKSEVRTEKARLDNIVSNIQEKIILKDFEGARIIVSNIAWLYEPGKNIENVEYYNLQRERLRREIDDYFSEKERIERTSVSVSYRAETVTDKAYFYDDPKVSSRRNNVYIVRGDVVSVTKECAEFAYVVFKTTDGWVLKSNLSRVNEYQNNNGYQY